MKNLPAWWRHQMESFSASLALCEGNSPITGEFRSQRPVTQSFDVFIDLRLNSWANHRDHSAHYDVTVMGKTYSNWLVFHLHVWPVSCISNVTYDTYVCTLWTIPISRTFINKHRCFQKHIQAYLANFYIVMNLYKCNDIVFASHKTYFFFNY